MWGILAAFLSFLIPGELLRRKCSFPPQLSRSLQRDDQERDIALREEYL